MVPFIMLLVVVLLLRTLGLLGVRVLRSWRTCVRLGLFVMFVFTGLTHFSRMKHDYAAMIPPSLPPALGLVYLTGFAEIVLAVGLLFPGSRKAAATALIVLLVALFPANVYAALLEIPFGGRPPTPLLPRTLIQMAFILLVWWSCLRQPSAPARGGP